MAAVLYDKQITDINIPIDASAIVTTNEVIDAISSL
jgi:hypothetical protein